MLHEKRRLTALRGLLLPVTAVLVLLCFLTALSNLAQGQDDEGKRQLEDAIRRSAVAWPRVFTRRTLPIWKNITASRSMRAAIRCTMIFSDRT